MNSADRMPAARHVAVGLLCLAAVTAPLGLGATGPWPRFGVEAAMAGAVILWVVGGGGSTRLLALVLAIAAVGLVQILPLPPWLLSAVAPVAAQAWRTALQELPGGWLPAGWGSISVDPGVTAAATRRVMLAAATMAVAGATARRPAARRWLGASLALAGGLVWALGLAFPFDNQRLVLLGFVDCRGPIESEFWRTPLVPAGETSGSGLLQWVTAAGVRYRIAAWVASDGFGPYICSNHFAGAICLTLPVALGGWLAVSRGRLPGVVRQLVVAAVLAAALWTVGIRAASRAGAASLVLAALALPSLAWEWRWPRRMATALLLLSAALIAGFGAMLYGPLGWLEGLAPAALQPRLLALLHDGRAVAARVALRMFAAAPLLGSGLGTYGELFPQLLPGESVLGFAHNDYAQLLAETGLVGGAGLVAGGVWFARRCRGFLRAPPGPDRPLEAGAWAALAGIAAHSAFDWNLHVPANALLACLVAGLAAASGAEAGPDVAGPAATRQPDRMGIGAGLLVVLCLLALALAGRDAASATAQRGVREAIVAARLADLDPTRPRATGALTGAIAAGERLARWDPASAELQLLLGQARLHLAGEPRPRAEADALRVAADRSFGAARRRSAACLGLPDAVPGADGRDR